MTLLVYPEATPSSTDMPRQNAASRVLSVAVKVPQQANNTVVLDGWAAVFGVQDQEPTVRGQEVARMLGMLYHQVGIVRADLESRDFDRDAYVPVLDRVTNSLAMTSLGNQWNWVAQFYTPDVIAALRVFPGILPDEAVVEVDEIAQVQTYLGDLRQRVANGELPAEIKYFLIRQIELIDRALRDYAIRGVAAFQEASEQAGFEWLREGQVVAPYKDHAVVQEVGTLWPRVQTLVKRATLIGAFAGTLLGGVDKALHIAKDLRLLPGATQEAPVTFPVPTPPNPDAPIAEPPEIHPGLQT
jgi:hypothetical protein